MAQTKLLLADLLPFRELGGLDPPGNRQMIRRWTQVLADRDDVDADRGKVGHGGNNLVERLPHPDDGRQVLVALTPAGRDLVDAAVVDHAANQLDLVSSLTDRQRTQLTELLRKLDRGINDAG